MSIEDRKEQMEIVNKFIDDIVLDYSSIFLTNLTF